MTPSGTALWKHRALFVVSLGIMFSVTGCVADDEVDKATTQFVQASGTLLQQYQALLNGENLLEADDFIDNQVGGAITNHGQPPQPPETFAIDNTKIAATAVLTADEIKFRLDAVKALTAYTTALGTLAANKPPNQMQTDAQTAGANLSTLTSDSANIVLTPPNGGKNPDFGTPAKTAAAAMTDVIKLIEEHQGANAIQASIRSNDSKVAGLYSAINTEAQRFYERQKTHTNTLYLAELDAYALLLKASPIDSVGLLDIGDRLKQHQQDLVTLGGADPKAAMSGFQKSHDALVALVTAPKGEDKKTLAAKLMAEIKSFASDVKAPAKSSSSDPSPGATTNPN